MKNDTLILPGDKIKLSDKQIIEQELSEAVVQAMIERGYCTVQAVHRMAANQIAVSVEEDPSLLIRNYYPMHHGC